MIELQRITTADKELYAYMEQLLTASFPSDEYRDLQELREYTDHKPAFHNNIILNDGQPIGLITYWDFNTFYYFEHFAIDPAQRNGGYGKQVLGTLIQQLQHPLVLEVEEPVEEMAKRRINFYKRLGLQLWDKEYQQPSYKPDGQSLPMYLMATDGLDCEQDFERVKQHIYREVYNVR